MVHQCLQQSCTYIQVQLSCAWLFSNSSCMLPDSSAYLVSYFVYIMYVSETYDSITLLLLSRRAPVVLFCDWRSGMSTLCDPDYRVLHYSTDSACVLVPHRICMISMICVYKSDMVCTNSYYCPITHSHRHVPPMAPLTVCIKSDIYQYYCCFVPPLSPSPPPRPFPII